MVPNRVGANGFRVLSESGDDVFLDFLSYSEDANQALIVARVRMRETALQGILARVNAALDGRDCSAPHEENMATFEAGVFQTFRATTGIHLGPIGKDIPKDGILEYDGETAKFNGQTFSMPQIKAAITARWFVPSANTTAQYVSASANIMVRDAQHAGNDNIRSRAAMTVDEDFATVGKTLSDPTKLSDPNRQSEQSRLSAEDRHKARQALVKMSEASSEDEDPEVSAALAAYKAALAKKANAPVAQRAAPQRVELSQPAARQDTKGGTNLTFNRKGKLDIEDQDAVPVAQMLTPAVVDFKSKGDGSMDSEIRRIENPNGRFQARVAKIVKPGAVEMDAENISKVPPAPRVRSTIAEGESITARRGDTSGDVATTVVSDDYAELFPDALVVPNGQPKVAAQLNWDKDRHWKVRVKDACDNFMDNPAGLRQIFAVESETVVKEIKKAFGID